MPSIIRLHRQRIIFDARGGFSLAIEDNRALYNYRLAIRKQNSMRAGREARRTAYPPFVFGDRRSLRRQASTKLMMPPTCLSSCSFHPDQQLETGIIGTGDR